MRKDVKFVVAAACLLLIGLLAYVLFAPSHQKGEVADQATPSETGAGTSTATSTSTGAQEQHTPAPAVNVSLAPATQPTSPAVSVSLAPATQPSSPSVAISSPVVPAVDSNVPVGSAPAASTDWDKTLNSGAVATATGTHAALSGSTLMGATDSSPLGASTAGPSAAGPATRPSSSVGFDATASTTGAKKHKVAFGETLSSIAADYYGNRANYTKILAANPGVNANHLKVGTILTIPDLKGAKSEAAGSATAAEKAAPGTTYAVKSGDSLQKIATKLYGSSDKWQKIYELNRSSIGGDPHRLKAGTVLKLPEAPSASAR